MYDRHYPSCAACMSQGAIRAVARRHRAAIDLIPAASTARDLSRMSWKMVDNTGYPELVLGAGALVEVVGLPGQGKSTFATRLADGVKGSVLYVAAEEGLSPSFSARLLRANVRRQDFHVLSRASVDAAAAFIRDNGIVAAVVDSVSAASWTAAELRHLLSISPSLDLLVAVLQVTKDGQPAGSMQLQHECDVIVRVDSMKWSLTKSRYQDLGVTGAVLAAPSVDEAVAC